MSENNGSFLPGVHPMTISGYNQKSASFYDAKRPGYISEAVDLVLKHMDLNNIQPFENVSVDILELGAGTGKFTKSIHPKLNKSVKYVATDPMEGFLEQAKINCPGIKTSVCSAVKLPFEDCSVRFVIAAQSFHWFASEVSLKEIHRVLIPGGKFFCLWNNRDTSIPWVQSISDLLHEYYSDEIPRAVTGKWKKAFEDCPIFKEEFHLTLLGMTIKGDKQKIVDYFMAMSVIFSQSEDMKKQTQQRFMDLLNKFHPSDSEDLVLPFLTEVYSFVKLN